MGIQQHVGVDVSMPVLALSSGSWIQILLLPREPEDKAMLAYVSTDQHEQPQHSSWYTKHNVQYL